jgi:glycine C-acetyltransferase
VIEVVAGREFLQFSSNDYLGLAHHPEVIAAAKAALDREGFGTAGVRFVSGTRPSHLELESAISALLHMEETVLHGSCFDANGGVFEALLDEGDAVLSDELNHASIIDGLRLCKATRYRYRHRDLADLETGLRLAAPARRRLIVTDGVFSMNGHPAPLAEICDIADRHDAMILVDDSHGVGVLGPTGAGTAEAAGVGSRIDILTGTLGKALGGASGGYVSGRADLMGLVRRKSRPYLFSNAVPPAVAAGSSAALAIATTDAARRRRLHENAALLRGLLSGAGFDIPPGAHPIIPVVTGAAAVATRLAGVLRHLGVHVVAFSHPVVPRGEARLRIQVSAAHSEADIRTCADAFVRARDAPGPH